MIETEMKTTKPKIILLLLVLMAALLALSGYQWLSLQLQPVDASDSNPIELRLPEDSTASQVAALLAGQGLIRNERMFLAYCRQKDWTHSCRPGCMSLTAVCPCPSWPL